MDELALIQNLEITTETSRPGMVVGFRLASDKVKAPIRVCHRRVCFQASRNWELIPTLVDIPRDQFFLVQNKKGQSTLVRLYIRPPVQELDITTGKAKAPEPFKLRIPANVVAKLEANKDKIVLDRAHNEKILGNRTEKPWSPTWVLPMGSVFTSEFGALRTPPNGRPYAHSGLDLRARTGDKVHAASSGTVVSCEEQVLSGNVITIDHGRGVMTRYLHLSKFLVKVGDEVKAGDLIALSGATGRVEAPHLHWEVRVRGYPVDPVSTSQLLARLASSK